MSKLTELFLNVSDTSYVLYFNLHYITLNGMEAKDNRPRYQFENFAPLKCLFCEKTAIQNEIDMNIYYPLGSHCYCDTMFNINNDHCQNAKHNFLLHLLEINDLNEIQKIELEVTDNIELIKFLISIQNKYPLFGIKFDELQSIVTDNQKN